MSVCFCPHPQTFVHHSSIQELVEGETSRESNGKDTAEQRENDSAKNTQQNTRNSAYGTIM